MPISTDLSLADRFLDASIDGLLGTGLQVTRQQFMKFFPSYLLTAAVLLCRIRRLTARIH